MTNKIHCLKFSESGVRGIIGDSLTPLLVSSMASAFGRYVGGGKVIIGRDTRPSGEMLQHAAIAGLLAVGCQPVVLGVVPTPTVQIMVEEYKANGGIAITASHNPDAWNALKFIGPRGIFLDQTEAAELFDVYTQSNFVYSRETDHRDIRYDNQAFDKHMLKIFQAIDVETIRKCHFRVAVDCCNGVGALYSRLFLESLGCRVWTVFDRVNGKFERPPEPIEENLGELSKMVKTHHCAIGFAHDPDGDRMVFVQENGLPLSAQATVALLLDHLLSESPGAVAVNLQTTKAVEDIAASYGCETFYSKVGEINVVEKMFECNADIGGEGNCGGFIWRKVHPGRDSYVAMALALEMLATSQQQLSEIYSSVSSYVTGSLKLPCDADNARTIILTLNRHYRHREIWDFDGLRINLPNGWVLIRASNTEPVLRITAEFKTARQVEKWLQRIAEEINKIINADEKSLFRSGTN